MLLLAAASVLVAPAPATASSAEQALVDKINAERTSRGLRALDVRSDLVSVARRHSGRMADDLALYHNSNLGSEVSGWRSIAENVARGRSADKIHDGLMASGYHRDNILWSVTNQIGVGVVTGSDGRMYVTQIFVDRAGDGSSAPPVVRRAKPSSPEPVARAPKRRARPEPEPFTVDMLVEVLLFDHGVG